MYWVRIMLVVLLAGALGACAGRESGREKAARCNGVSGYDGSLSACVKVPAGEPASIGTMTVSIEEGSEEQVLNLEREGTPENVWLLPGAGRRPVIVQMTRSAGSGSYPVLLRLEPVYGGYAESDMAELTQEQRQGYMGHDRLEVFDGQLYRYFPVYKPGDSNSHPTGGESCYRYDFASEHWRHCPPFPGVEDVRDIQ